MSRVSKGIFGILAATLALGAAQLEIASGSDLRTNWRGDASLFGTRGSEVSPTQSAATEVNRRLKSDRLGNVLPGVSGPTIVFNVAGLANTSVATFMPLSQKASSSAPSKAGSSRAIVRTDACEPPVSALTELAKQIETGRCIT